MSKSIIIFLSALFYCSSVIGDVGFTSLMFKDQERKREMKTYIWYPTVQSSEILFAENMFFNGFLASENSQVSKKMLPLYILVHGTSGNWRNLSWLAAKAVCILSISRSAFGVVPENRLLSKTPGEEYGSR